MKAGVEGMGVSSLGYLFGAGAEVAAREDAAVAAAPRATGPLRELNGEPAAPHVVRAPGSPPFPRAPAPRHDFLTDSPGQPLSHRGASPRRSPRAACARPPGRARLPPDRGAHASV